MGAQLGRRSLIPFTVVARCGPGHPLVIRNAPVDAEGHPFPTLYWLTCPEAVRAVSRLESVGWIRRLQDRVEVEPELRTRLRRAHEDYARERGLLHPGAEAWGGVGGAARGVKCLHAHYAYTVAGGSDPIGNWVHRRLAEHPLHYERTARRVAAVDLGTNSIRLLVAKTNAGDPTLHDLARDMVITRLGQGVDRTGRLDPSALDRTLDVLLRYVRRAAALRAERVHLTATSAVRDAANRDRLADEVERLTGEPMEVLPGEDEGRLTYLGAIRGLGLAGAGPPGDGDVSGPRLQAEPPFLVLDIGGGSTEVVLGDAQPTHVVSTQMGSVRLTERFVRSDPPSTEDLDVLEAAVRTVLSQVDAAIPVRSARTLVAVAGTSTTVQAIALGLPEYDPERLHGTVLSRESAERVFRLLADMSTAERRALPVMAPGREDVIPAGAAILVGAMRRWGFDQAIVSETDILDGLAYRMVEGDSAR